MIETLVVNELKKDLGKFYRRIRIKWHFWNKPNSDLSIISPLLQNLHGKHQQVILI